jgi:hypothetical protein
MGTPGRIHPPRSPEATPEVAAVQNHLPDLKSAVERIGSSWNATQVEDALRSARYWLDEMEKTLKEQKTKRQ